MPQVNMKSKNAGAGFKAIVKDVTRFKLEPCEFDPYDFSHCHGSGIYGIHFTREMEYLIGKEVLLDMHSPHVYYGSTEKDTNRWYLEEDWLENLQAISHDEEDEIG